jgi:hypothetical protein
MQPTGPSPAWSHPPTPRVPTGTVGSLLRAEWRPRPPSSLASFHCGESVTPRQTPRAQAAAPTLLPAATEFLGRCAAASRQRSRSHRVRSRRWRWQLRRAARTASSRSIPASSASSVRVPSPLLPPGRSLLSSDT